VAEYAIFRETGYREHAFEFLFTTFQTFSGAAKVGQIQLTSNSRLTPTTANLGIQAAAFDMTSAGLQNGTAMFQLDSAQSFQLTNPNRARRYLFSFGFGEPVRRLGRRAAIERLAVRAADRSDSGRCIENTNNRYCRRGSSLRGHAG
jgi:hypothetical protein